MSKLIYTSYQERFRTCFADAYNFLDEHKQARSEMDFEKIVEDLKLFQDPLTVELIVAAVNEIEREYFEHTKGNTVIETIKGKQSVDNAPLDGQMEL